MDWIFEHLQIVVIIVLALASWLKKRSDDKHEEAEERRVREQMVRGLEEMAEATSSSTPANQERTPRPQVPRKATPPPLKKNAPAQAPVWSEAAEQVPVFEHDSWEDQTLLKQQRSIQERLVKAKKAQEEAKELANQAREKRLRVSNAFRTKSKPSPGGAGDIGIRQMLRSPRQARRAIALREILGPPVALK